MLTIADIFNLIDSVKRDPVGNLERYAKGGAFNLADMADLIAKAGNPGAQAVLGPALRDALGTSGTPMESAGEFLGLPQGTGLKLGSMALAKGAPTLAALAGTMKADDIVALIKKTLDKRGATVSNLTGKSPKVGYAVADVGTGLGDGPVKQIKIPLDEFTPKRVADEIKRNPELGSAENIGTWISGNNVYLDPSEIVKSPFAARLEAERRGQDAAWNLIKKREELPSIDAGKRIAMRDSAAKNEALAGEIPLSVPDGPEFWPWRVEHGGFKATLDKKKGWMPNKVMSDDEKKLADAIKAAEDRVYAGELPDVWDMSQLTRPEQQGLRLDYSTSVKGTPEWIKKQYGPQFVRFMKDKTLSAAEKGNPEAFKFYWTGQMQNDLFNIFGREEGQRMLQAFTDSLGATTASARPIQNVRMASYQDARMAQGLDPTGMPPFPYGHRYSEGTHLTNLRDLAEHGRLDPGTNPKGSTFSGNASGQTGDPTMDVVMSEGSGLRDSNGKLLQAPHKNAYLEPVLAFDKVTRDLSRTKGKLPPEVQQGLQSSDVQSGVWSELGGDPSYAKSLLRHISDRINVTSLVTGLPVDRVKEMFLRKQIPLLSVGGAGVGALTLGDMLASGQGGEQ